MVPNMQASSIQSPPQAQTAHACFAAKCDVAMHVTAGPRSDGGLGLQSFRAVNGLQARLRLPPRFQAFPGIVNGGVVSVAFDCHGNWTAAIALMDRAALPRPPFTLSSSLQACPIPSATISLIFWDNNNNQTCLPRSTAMAS